MTAIIKNRFRIQNAKDFLENLVGHPRLASLGTSLNFSEATEEELLEALQAELGSHVQDRNLYMFVGRARPWPTQPSAIPPISELAPPLPKDTIEEEARIWEGMLGCKKVNQIYGSLVVPRHDWDSSGNTVYKPFDDRDADLFNHPTADEISAANLGGYVAGSLYVITDEFHVFKCLSNNNGAKSTDKPTKPLASPYIFTSTVDGYSWKYMTTITPAQVVRFLTDRWIPVVTLSEDDGSTQWLVQQDALTVSGAIESFLIDNTGSGYEYVHSGTLVSSTATEGILEVGASTTDDVYVGSEIHIVNGTGAGEIREITDYDSATRTITVDASWSVDATSEYEILPKLVIVGNGTGASAKPVVETAAGPNQYKIVGITIINGGSGYTFADVNISGGGGSAADVRAVLAGPQGHGSDIEKELGGFFAMVNTRLQYNEGAGDFPISNDYRQIGLIRDLKNFDGSLASAETRIATKQIELSGISGSFSPDDQIVGISGSDTATAKVVDYVAGTPGTGTLTYFQDLETGIDPFLEGMDVSGPSGSGTIIVGGLTDEEIKKFDGEILYIENRRPVLRAPDQIEDIKAIVEF